MLLALSACASLDYEDYRQPVLILSDPPGAKIYEGRRFLGTTPAYARVSRGRKPRLRLVSESGESRDVRLKTEYRWRDSGAMNLLLLTLAPVGWLADWATGTAWRVSDPPVQTFGSGGKWPQAREPKVIAIAPPATEDMDISDGLGMAIESKLRASRKVKVLDYETTAPAFQFYQAGAGPPGDKENRYRLIDELKADHILYSQSKRKGDAFYVTSHLNDVVSGQTSEVYNFQVTPGESLKGEFTRRRWSSHFFHLLPNTFFLNFSGYTPNLTVDDVEYQGKEAAAEDSVDRYLKYLSAISIATLQRPMANVRGQWTFDFVPAVVLSKKTMEFPRFAPVAGVQFERLYASAGYGFEAGYLWRHGHAYLDFIPTYTWSQVSYTTLTREGTAARHSIQSVLEIGYNKFFSEHFVGRLFVRNVAEDIQLWSKVLTEVSGQPTYATDAGSVFVGFAVGYYFPSTLKSKKGWTVKDASR